MYTNSILITKSDYSLYILGAAIILLQLNYTYPDPFSLGGLGSRLSELCHKRKGLVML